MASEIIINSNPRETRVALVEKNQLAEIFIEHKTKKGIVGNIYKGLVTKILPGMQVAFVDIGLEKAGFLYVGDIDVIDLMEFENDDEDLETMRLSKEKDEASQEESKPSRMTGRGIPILHFNLFTSSDLRRR